MNFHPRRPQTHHRHISLHHLSSPSLLGFPHIGEDDSHRRYLARSIEFDSTRPSPSRRVVGHCEVDFIGETTVPCVEVNALMRTFKMKPLMFPLDGFVTTIFNCQGPRDAPVFVGSGMATRKITFNLDFYTDVQELL